MPVCVTYGWASTAFDKKLAKKCAHLVSIVALHPISAISMTGRDKHCVHCEET